MTTSSPPKAPVASFTADGRHSLLLLSRDHQLTAHRSRQPEKDGSSAHRPVRSAPPHCTRPLDVVPGFTTGSGPGFREGFQDRYVAVHARHGE